MTLCMICQLTCTCKCRTPGPNNFWILNQALYLNRWLVANCTTCFYQPCKQATLCKNYTFLLQGTVCIRQNIYSRFYFKLVVSKCRLRFFWICWFLSSHKTQSRYMHFRCGYLRVIILLTEVRQLFYLPRK